MKENLEEALKHYRTIRAEKGHACLDHEWSNAGNDLDFGRRQMKRMAFELANELNRPVAFGVGRHLFFLGYYLA